MRSILDTGRRALPSVVLALAPLLARAQELPRELAQPEWQPEGWAGFMHYDLLGNALLTLTLAAVLGAVIGYHPRRLATADTLEEIEAPKAYVTYAVIGAFIGIMVLKFGLVVGFVVFGIGGLIRFRTVMQSASMTGYAIFVTLVGLSCGLNLPHIAVLATAFGFVLIYILDARVTYRIAVKGLSAARVVEAAAAYRGLLENHGCRIVSEKRDLLKERVVFIFRSHQRVTPNNLDELFATRIDPALKGAVDWEID
jgi:hypothetical protein